MNQPPKYRFYPSLLDKFEQYLRADEQVESFWNVDNETGEYKKSPEEIEAELKQTLLDAINRVPFESEAADRGTAFNAIIDCYIHRKKHIPNEREPYTIIGDEETNIIQVAFPSTDIAPARHFCLTEHGVLNSRGILLVHCLKSLSLPLFPPVTVMWSFTGL